MSNYKPLDYYQGFFAVCFGIILIIEILLGGILSIAVGMAINDIRANVFSLQALYALIFIADMIGYPVIYFLSLFMPARLRRQNKPISAFLVMLSPSIPLFVLWFMVKLQH